MIDYKKYIDEFKKKYEIAEQITRLDKYLEYIKSMKIQSVELRFAKKDESVFTESYFNTRDLHNENWKSLIEIFLLDWKEDLIKQLENANQD